LSIFFYTILLYNVIIICVTVILRKDNEIKLERFSICIIDEWDKNVYIISKKLQVFYLLCILPYSSLLSNSHDVNLELSIVWERSKIPIVFITDLK
jgi:hypothetical protein